MKTPCRKISRQAIAAVIAIISMTSSAHAALVTFEGRVDVVDAGLTSVFNTGMTVSGSFLVDESAIILSGPTFARYATSTLQANIGGSYAGADATGGFSDAIDQAGFDNIGYSNTTLGDSTFASIGTFDPWAFSLRLDDNSGTALGGTAFPASIDIADFPNIHNWALSFKDLTGLQQNVRGNLTSVGVSPVPPPAALWLFATALLGIIGYAKSRSSNPV